MEQSSSQRSLFRTLAFAQGAYYVFTGLWPVIDIRTFMILTGPKRDLWLVKSIGLLFGCIGSSLLLAAWDDRAGERQHRILATGTALCMAGIDIVYVERQRISPVYLLDALAELALAAGWLGGMPAGQRR